MAEEILRADQRLRRIANIVAVLGVFAALTLMWVFKPWLNQRLGTMTNHAAVIALQRGVAYGLLCQGLCTLLVSGYCARLATRIQQQHRWPLEGARVLKDTLVRRGEAALRVGRLFNIAAVTLVALAAVLGLLSWNAFSALR